MSETAWLSSVPSFIIPTTVYSEPCFDPASHASLTATSPPEERTARTIHWLETFVGDSCHQTEPPLYRRHLFLGLPHGHRNAEETIYGPPDDGEQQDAAHQH